MTIWNKFIQSLVDTDEAGLRLALTLLTDKKSLIHWYGCTDDEQDDLGIKNRRRGGPWGFTCNVLDELYPKWLSVRLGRVSNKNYLYLKSIKPSS